MFLLYNIVSDTMYYVVVCVDFLGTHMASLVCSSKLGVTPHLPQQVYISLMTVLPK
jgi:hypothetical protein